MTVIEDRPRLRRSGKPAAALAVLLLMVQVLLLTGAYAAGRHTSPYAIRAGQAYMASTEFSVMSGNWTYGGPYPESWHDDSGWHSGGEPSCVPPAGGEVANLRFAAVTKSAPEFGIRPVAWIDCSGSHAIPG